LSITERANRPETPRSNRILVRFGSMSTEPTRKRIPLARKYSLIGVKAGIVEAYHM
jgi:hypothetical protein